MRLGQNNAIKRKCGLTISQDASGRGSRESLQDEERISQDGIRDTSRMEIVSCQKIA
jgi:hypothetical protein